jgi:hypothetical protein
MSALAFYKGAHELDSEREDILEAILRLSAKHDLLVDAHMAADVLARRHPEDPQRLQMATSIDERLRVQRLSGVKPPTRLPE